MKKILFIVFVLLSVFLLFRFRGSPITQRQNFATIVFPIRGRQYWRTNSDIEQLGQMKEVVKTGKVASTWLLQYDALSDDEITRGFTHPDTNEEVGLFLEVTYKLAKESYVNYPWESERWERADKVFLSGYTVQDRKKLIDKVFTTFHKQFGYYPKSVGAWHIDAWSVDYIRSTYGVKVALTCADQYLTDGYQIWGQYWGSPFYPSRRNVLEPAANQSDNLGVLTLQWAMRDPLKGYGIGAEVSNHSTQVNDYARSLKLTPEHFPRLVDSYAASEVGKIGQITLGIEVGEIDSSYLPELARQFQIISEKGLRTTTMSQFADIFHDINQGGNIASTIRGTDGDVSLSWYNTPLFRMGVKADKSEQKIVDLKVYNRELLWNEEYWFKDSRQNLMRLIPSVVDEVGLHNAVGIVEGSLTVRESSVSFRVKNVKDSIAVLKKCDCRLQVSADKVTLQFSQRPSLFIQPSEHVYMLSSLLQKVIPDIRFAKLSGKIALGIRIHPEYLLGADLSKPSAGAVYFKYPTLEAFKNFRQQLQLRQLLFTQSDIEIVPYRLAGNHILSKDTSYGIDKMKELYKQSPIFENSNYLVY